MAPGRVREPTGRHADLRNRAVDLAAGSLAECALRAPFDISPRWGTRPAVRGSRGVRSGQGRRRTSLAAAGRRCSSALRVSQSWLGRLDNQQNFRRRSAHSDRACVSSIERALGNVLEIAEPLAPDLVCPLLLKLAQGWGLMVRTPLAASVCQRGSDYEASVNQVSSVGLDLAKSWSRTGRPWQISQADVCLDCARSSSEMQALASRSDADAHRHCGDRTCATSCSFP